MDFLNVALPVAYVLVGIALIWFLIELVLTLRKARQTVDDLQKQLEPTLQNVEQMTESLKPAVAKVDPLVERASLTVDAANLEVMRLDGILEDVGEITGSVANATNAVEKVTGAPVELVNNVTERVRKAFTPKKASDESVALGADKGKEAAGLKDAEAAAKASETTKPEAEAKPAPAQAEAAQSADDAEDSPKYYTYNDAVASVFPDEGNTQNND